ncbi:CueP family metal-binding protein [Nocardioides sp. BYT-33-1]|uniref:CueP family metal-binding protein n=1 Tax=Nocardioides sp. BYT-33-1 TaxID=3416952 RepID=UPI003F52E5A1
MTHSPHLSRTRLLVAAAVAALASTPALAGCGADDPAPSTGPTGSSPSGGAAGSPGGGATVADLLAEHGLSGLDTMQVVDRLDAMPVAERPGDLIASVRPDSLVLTDGAGREARMPMPEDRVYVSVAPYRERTHECHFHSLTTCLGELPGAEVRVTLTRDDGRVLLDERRRTFDNGFTGLWVPRGIAATLTVSSDGRSGSAPVSTVGADDPTCITTLRMV